MADEGRSFMTKPRFTPHNEHHEIYIYPDKAQKADKHILTINASDSVILSTQEGTTYLLKFSSDPANPDLIVTPLNVAGLLAAIPFLTGMRLRVVEEYPERG